MADRRNILVLLLLSLCSAQSTLAATEAEAACSEARHSISQQIKEARLTGDLSQRATLELRLRSLTERCRGVAPLQPNHAEIKRATRLATEREAQLREALGTGNQQDIEVSKRRLDQARKQLEAAKR